MSSLLSIAIDCGQWMIRNQVAKEWDANCGRPLWCYDNQTGEYALGNNWMAGITAMSLLSLYKHTKDEAYLEAAQKAGRYIMSCQIVDPNDQRYFGAIRECTPQTNQFCPRDAVSAAWALVWLYEATGDEKYINRAILFADWHLKYGMNNGWPVWHVEMTNKKPNSYWAGAFQSGTGLFYLDLFNACDDHRYIQQGLKPIADKYRDDFIDQDGCIIGIRDGFTWDIIKTTDYGMHYYNDDFGAAMLQGASDFFKDQSYRDKAYSYTKWLASKQESDGSFGDEYPSGVPVSMIYFNDLGDFYKDEKLLNAGEKALSKLQSMQFLVLDNPKMHGAFSGVCEIPDKPQCVKKNVLNLRTTAYALIALLKVKSNITNMWLGRHNREFEDPNIKRKNPEFIF